MNVKDVLPLQVLVHHKSGALTPLSADDAAQWNLENSEIATLDTTTGPDVSVTAKAEGTGEIVDVEVTLAKDGSRFTASYKLDDIVDSIDGVVIQPKGD